MANVRKRISELTALTSASLDTTLVGVDGGTTYKIELDTLADAVTSRVNILDRDRLNALESVTSSFETKGRSVISSSTQITSYGFISESVNITSLNSFTSSQSTLNTAFTNGINSRLTTSSFNDFSSSVHTEILAATNEQDLSYLVTTSSFNTYTASISTGSLVDRLSSLENNTGSYLTSLNGTISSSAQITSFGFISESIDISSLNSFTSSQQTLNTAFNNGISARLQTSSFNDFSASVDSRIIAATNEQSFNGLISGSSQLTSSYDERYVLSGSITQTTWDNIANKPTDIISSSQQIADLGFVTGSYTTINTFNSLTQSFNSISQSFTTISSSVGSVDFNGLISGSSQLTSSYDTRYVLSGSITQTTWDNIANKPIGIVSSSVQVLGGSGVVSGSYETTGRGIISSSANLVTTSSFNSYTASISTASLVTSINNLNSATSSYLTSLSGAISSSSQLTSSFDTRYAPSASYLTSLNGVFSSSIQTLGGSGVYSSSAQLPVGLISGSSQLTSSYDTRYTLSGSVVSGTTPAGTISGSSQLTSSFDGRYVQTGSFNTLTASFNSFTASAQSVTTGSNSFNGTQTITGSLIITTGSFIGSQILANTSSLYLTSGSNMYVQNNGVVEITGSLKVRGTTRFETVGGDEGGEIEFGVPQTNTTLSTRVVADIFQNRLRIFDGNTNGVFIDLSKAPTGVGGELTWKVSGYVNAGTFVQLDNVKVTIPTSGNRGASIGAVSTSFTANISATFGNSAGTGGNAANTVSYTTTAAASAFGWNFGAAGDGATYILNDTTNSRVYRIITMIGTSYNNNFISIERLH